MKRVIFALALLGWLGGAQATGFTDYGQDLLRNVDTWYSFHGAFRLRGMAFHNLDLDRGPTPSGELFFPVSLSDPKAQTLYASDMRLRTDLGLQAPGGIVGVKLRMDVLDNLPLGGSVDGFPGASITQAPPEAFFRIKRAYGEVLTPLGYLAAGRMGHHFGLGMLGNGGDCPDCDSGDSADRIAFVTPLLGHIFAFAYDFSAAGHLVERDGDTLTIDVEPSAAVRSVAVAILRWKSDRTRDRRTRAGKLTAEYGAFYAHRWQDDDIPITYLPVATPSTEVTPAQVMQRGLSAHAVDVWARLTHPLFRMELEAAYLYARVEQASLLPGLELPEEVTSDQLGIAFESECGAHTWPVTFGFDAGFASGDEAPGFGAKPPLTRLTAPKPGDLDGPQGVPPHDLHVNNFRFHPDYRIDRILFREIIGTITDAIYLRPHFRWKIFDWGPSRLIFQTALVASWAHHASSTPSGERPLGVEIDPTLTYTTKTGLSASLEYAVLFPLAGLDNPELGLRAKPAQLFRMRLGFGF